MGTTHSKAIHSYLEGHIVEIIPQRELLASPQPLMVSSSSSNIHTINPFIFQQRRKITYDQTKQKLLYELAITSPTTNNSTVNNANQLFKVFGNRRIRRAEEDDEDNKDAATTNIVDSLTFIPLCLLLDAAAAKTSNNEKEVEDSSRQRRSSSTSSILIPQDYLLNQVTIVPDNKFKIGKKSSGEHETVSFKIILDDRSNKNLQPHDQATTTFTATTAEASTVASDAISSLCVDQKTNKIVTVPSSEMKSLDIAEKEKPGTSLLLQHFAIRIVPYPMLAHPSIPAEDVLFDQFVLLKKKKKEMMISSDHGDSGKNDQQQSSPTSSSLNYANQQEQDGSGTFIPTPTSTKQLTLSIPPFELTNFSRPDFRVSQEGANTNLGVTPVKLRTMQPLMNNIAQLNSTLREFKIYVKSPPGSHSRQSSFRKKAASAVVVRGQERERGGTEDRSKNRRGEDADFTNEVSPRVESGTSSPSSSSSSSTFLQNNNNSPFPVISIHTSQPVVLTNRRSHFDFDNHEGIFALSVPSEEELISKMKQFVQNPYQRDHLGEPSMMMKMSGKKFGTHNNFSGCPIVLNPVKLGSSLQNFRLEPCLGDLPSSVVEYERGEKSSKPLAKTVRKTDAGSVGECASDFEGYFYLVYNEILTLSSKQDEEMYGEDFALLNQNGLVLDLDLSSADENDLNILPNERMMKDANELNKKKKNMMNEKNTSSTFDDDPILPPIPLCLRPKCRTRRHTQLWSFVSRVPLAELEKRSASYSSTK